MKCSEVLAEGIEKIGQAYKPIIEEAYLIIEDMKKRGLDPRRFYDPKNRQEIDLVAFVSDMTNQLQADVSAIKKEVDKTCLEPHEKYLKYILDLSIVYFTDGLSLILPKHMTDIDVKKILQGQFLGGPNTVFSQIKDKIFDSLGVPRNNDLRRAIETPGREIGRIGNNVSNEVGSFLRRNRIRW